MRYLRTIYALLVVLLFSCCSGPKSGSDGPKIAIQQKTITFEKGYDPVSDGENELENRVSSLTAYLFNGDQLVDVYNDLSMSSKTVSLKLKFEEGQTTHLYFVANSTDVGKITPGSISRNDFLRLEVGKQDQLIPNYLVMSGGMEILPAQNEHKVKMNRGMARLDMNSKNALLFIKKFTIIHTQKEQFLFPKSIRKGAETITFANFEHTFETPLNGRRAAVGYIHEQQNDNLSVLVEYQFNGVEGNVSIAMPSTIDRNLVYQIELDLPDLSLPDQITGSVNAIDWGEGTDDVATPETNGKVKIVSEESTIPAAAGLDAVNRVLHLSFRGGEATLAFDGEYNKRFELVTADSRISIASIDTPYRGSKLEIKATQPINGEAYCAKIKVYKDYIPNDPGVEITVNIDANRMPTVRMGGLIWMAYNGVGNDLSLYPPLEFKETMRDVYAKEWKKYSGITMWGPRGKPVPFLYPWEYVRTILPNGANLDGTASLWLPTAGNIPCPDGWRLPTYAELSKIWPPQGRSVDETYTIGKVTYQSFRMDVAMSEFLADDKKTVIKPKIFVISDGKNELVFPMVGWRRRDDYAGYRSAVAADAGNSFYLWTQNKGNQPWNSKVVGVMSDGKSYLNEGDNQQAMTEAYNAIRCVREEE